MKKQLLLGVIILAFFISLGSHAKQDSEAIDEGFLAIAGLDLISGDVASNSKKKALQKTQDLSQNLGGVRSTQVNPEVFGDAAGNGGVAPSVDIFRPQLRAYQRVVQEAARRASNKRTRALLEAIDSFSNNVQIERLPVGSSRAFEEFRDPYHAACSRQGDSTIFMSFLLTNRFSGSQMAEILTYHMAYLVGEDDPKDIAELVDLLLAEIRQSGF